MIDSTAFINWIREAKRGQSIEYHRGFLARDTVQSSTLHCTAMCALDAFDQKNVHLVQARHGPCDYSYLAIRR